MLQLKVLTIILIVTQIQPIYSFSNELLLNETNAYFTKCNSMLLEKYFTSSEMLSGSVISININSENPDLQQSALKKIHEDFNLQATVTIKDIKQDSDINDIDIPGRIRNYLIFVNEVDELKEIIDDLKTFPSWNSLAQVVIIFLNETDYDELEWDAMDEVKTHFLNVNIIINRDDKIRSFSAYPYGNTTCNNDQELVMDLVDECVLIGNSTDDDDDNDNSKSDDESIQVEEKLGSKIEDKFPQQLHGCPITVAARAWEPFTYYNTSDILYAGIDLMIMKTISEMMNLTTNIYLDNRTLYHVFQSVIEKEIHLVIGGVDEDPSISQLISTSVPYFQDDLTWCVANADRSVNWTSFLYLFDGITWALIAISVFALGLGLFYGVTLYKETKGLFKILSAVSATLINQSPNIFSIHISIRMMLILVFIFSLVINTAYQSFLISSLTHPRQQHQISTIEELYKNSFHVTGGLETLRHLTKEDEVTSYLRKKLVVCGQIESCLKNAADVDSSLAVAASREHVFYNPRIPRDNLFCFPRSKNIYSFFVSLITAKQNHLINHINSIIQQIIESGHIIKWTRDINNERTLKDQMIKRQDIPSPRLTLGQVKGPFFFGAILLGIAIAAFSLELTVYRKAKKERELKKRGFWYNLHRKLYRI